MNMALSVLRAAGVAICVVDREAKIAFANHEAEVLLGAPIATLTDRCLADRITARDLGPGLVPLIDKALAGEPTRGFEAFLTGPDGRVPVELAIDAVKKTHAVVTLRDVTDVELVADAVRLARRRLEALVANLRGAVLVEDERRRVVLANDAFCAMFAAPVPAAQLVGMDCAGSAAAAAPLFRDSVGFERRIAELLEARLPALEEKLELSDGRTLERDYLPIDVEGVRRGHLWVYRDITQRVLEEQTLRAAMAAAEEGSRAKDAFCAMLSHELRTPLAGILGMVDVQLHDATLEADQRTALGTVQRAGENLLTLINDLLDFAKIREGRFMVEARPCAPLAEIREAVEPLRSVASEKGLVVDFVVEEGVPELASTDAVRLRQVVTNLVGNAIKFTERGGVTVRAACRGPRVLRVEVDDTGIGIPAAERGRIFDPFAQGEAGAARRYGGTGLGLAICRQIVERLGGRIDFEARVPLGTRFFFELPLGAVEAVREAEANTSVSARVARLRVLSAEDDEVNRLVAARMLAHLRCDVVFARQGDEAVATYLEQGPFDLVLMDCQMPGVDGFEATRRLRSEGVTAPIVAMTANAMQGDRERCLAAGMDDHVSKPVSLQTLEAILARWGERRPSARAPSQPSDPVLDDSLLESLGGAAPPDLRRELRDLYLRDATVRVDRLRAAVASNDLREVTRLSHALKGASSSVGARRLARRAALLEKVDAETLPSLGALLVAELDRDLAAVRELMATW
ncbi:MAG: response regulator [Myxococcales bacterium]|nr:response regulator [Myxococcales bacterium]